MASHKGHIRHCILSAFQSNENAAEVAKMTYYALGKVAMIHSTLKIGIKDFAKQTLTSKKKNGQRLG